MTTEQTEAVGTEQEEGQVDNVGIMVNLPLQLKTSIKSAAENNGKTISAFVREIMAERVGYTGPLGSSRRRRKYASDEERAAVTKAREQARREMIKDLMSKYESELKTSLEQAEQQALAKSRGSEETDNGSEPVTQPPRQFDADSENQ